MCFLCCWSVFKICKNTLLFLFCNFLPRPLDSRLSYLVSDTLRIKKDSHVTAEYCGQNHNRILSEDSNAAYSTRFAPLIDTELLARTYPYRPCSHKATAKAMIAGRFATSLFRVRKSCDTIWTLETSSANRRVFSIVFTHSCVPVVAVGLASVTNAQWTVMMQKPTQTCIFRRFLLEEYPGLHLSEDSILRFCTGPVQWSSLGEGILPVSSISMVEIRPAKKQARPAQAPEPADAAGDMDGAVAGDGAEDNGDDGDDGGALLAEMLGAVIMEEEELLGHFGICLLAYPPKSSQKNKMKQIGLI